MTLTLRYAVRSDRGLVRGNNEDSVYAGPRLLAIADGMGGHAAGEVASKMVIGELERLDEDRPLGDLLSALRSAVLEANHGLSEAIESDADLDGMGTTLTALRFVGGQVGLVHVGDSRAYLLRNDHLAQITHDDTYVQSLVDSGKITAEEALHHPRKSVILRALMGSDVDPDVSIREARAGDRYLLCTDGLSDVVTAATIEDTLREGDAQEAADRLVDLALRGGGPDNVTCVVADVVDDDYGDDLPVIAGAFVDLDAQADSGGASPAERAARMTSGPTDAELAAPPRPPRRWLRRSLATLGVLVVVFGGIAAFYAWTQTQYFVGRDGSEVAIFRGVNTEFGPIKFYDVSANSDIKMDDLTQAARDQVTSGITAHNLGDAQRVIANLMDQRLPTCDSLIVPVTPTPTPTPTPTLTPTATAAHPTKTPPRTTAKAPAPRTTAKAAAGKTTPKATARVTPKATPKTTPHVKPTPTPTPTPTVTAPTPTPSPAVPGVNCRTA
jgi:protein phosphatase